MARAKKPEIVTVDSGGAVTVDISRLATSESGKKALRDIERVRQLVASIPPHKRRKPGPAFQ